MELITLGDQAVLTGNERLALRHYLAAAKLDQSDYSTLYKIGALQKRRGNAVAATHAFELALDLNPDDVASLDSLAVLRIAQGEFEESAELLDRFEAVAPESWRAPYLRGLLAMEKGDFGRAEYQLTIALGRSPSNPEILIRRGEAHLMNNRLFEAEGDLHAARKVPLYQRQADQQLGILYLKKKDYASALEALMRTATKSTALTNVGQAAVMHGNVDDAVFYLREAMRESPTYNAVAADALQELGQE